MYNIQVITQDQALAHLLLHCCLKDGRFEDAEIDKVSEIFVQYGLQQELNFKDEVHKYREYFSGITDEKAFVDYLVSLIMSVNELALFSWCVELMLIDDLMSIEEEALLEKIADALNILDEEKQVINELMVQRKVVLSEKIC